MHFGRVEQLTNFDAALPPDSARTEKFLALPRDAVTQVHVGCPIWSSKEWTGEVYPKGTKPGDFLKTYSKIFSTVELNSSFYHLPVGGQISRWRDETPPGFRFCPKVFRGITEDLKSPQLPGLVDQYCQAVLHFQDRLGLTFAQFPEWFAPNQKRLLEKFLNLWPDEVPLAVELRHPAWFQNHTLPDDIVNLFYRRNVASLITDTAGRRDVLHFSLTQPRVLIRFQGNNGHPLDELRLKEWARRIHKWKQHHLETIYFFTHQPGDAKIPETARIAAREIEGIELPRPPAPPQAAQQLEIF